MIKEQQEKILQLRCQGQSYADIANIIGVSKESVRPVEKNGGKNILNR